VSRLSSRVHVPSTIELPTDRPTIIAANHSSMFDLAAALIILGEYGINARIGVNSRFFKNPVAGKFLRSIGSIPFSKDDRETAEQEMVDALLAGQAAALMPEGRITREEDQTNGVGPGRPGVSRIARRAGAAVVPVGIAFAEEAWRPGTPLPKPRLGRHSVQVKIGEPIVFESDDHVANAELLMVRVGEVLLSARSSRDD
jgi:1-acyl-sn-glycerol-3-phosphate acyltransferase